jgi:hypothetical protein
MAPIIQGGGTVSFLNSARNPFGSGLGYFPGFGG